MAERLTTTKEVIAALGGLNSVAEITGSSYKAVSNWGGFDTFPARHFLVMTAALRKRGKSAPASLWNMTEAEQVAS